MSRRLGRAVIGFARGARRTWRWLWRNWFVVALSLMLAAGVLRTFSWGIYNIYRFNAGLAGLLESEWAKALATGWPQYQLIKRINWFLPLDSVILLYRVSDFAYYGKRRYVSYIDSSIADYARMKTDREVWEFLRKKGITHVYIPPYPLASISNTRLGDVLASPVYSQLEYDIDGYRLYRLKKTPEQEPSPKLIAGQDFAAQPDLLKEWKVFVASPLNRLLMRLRPGGFQSMEWLRIPPYMSFLTMPDSERLAYPGQLKYQYSPLMVKESFPFRAYATYGFSADVEGFGLLRIYLYSFQFSYGHPGDTGYTSSISSVQRTLIWAGTLHGKPRKIRAQFTVPPFLQFGHKLVRPKRSYRLVVEAGSNLASIRLRRWAVRAFTRNSASTFLQSREWASKQNFLTRDWELSAALYGDDLIQNLLFGMRRDGQVFIYNDNMHPVDLVSAAYVPASEASAPAVSGASTLRSRSDGKGGAPLDPALQQVAILRFRARGHGLFHPGILFVCQDSEGEIRNRGSVGEMSYLLTGRERAFHVEIPAPCRVRALAMIARLSRDEYSADHRVRLRLPIVELRDVEMATRFVNRSGGTSLMPFMSTGLAPAHFLKSPKRELDIKALGVLWISR